MVYCTWPAHQKACTGLERRNLKMMKMMKMRSLKITRKQTTMTMITNPKKRTFQTFAVLADVYRFVKE